MSNTIEAVFDGKVFHPESEVELKPNTRVEITVNVKSVRENQKEFRVRSRRLGIRRDLNYDKTSRLLEESEGVAEAIQTVSEITDANSVELGFSRRFGDGSLRQRPHDEGH